MKYPAWGLPLIAALYPLLSALPSSAQDAKLKSVTLAYVPSVDQVATIVGVNNGIFEKHGLDVRLSKPFPTGVDILNAMQAGAIDIGTVGLPLMGAALAGMDVAVIGLYTGSPVKARSDASYALIARKGSGIDAKDFQTFKGKKIGVTFSSTNQLYAVNLLKAKGVPVESVTFVNTAPGDMAVALQTQGVDAIASWEPWPLITNQTVEGSYEVIRGGGYVPNIGYIVVRGEFLRNQPDTVARFVKAHAEASQRSRAQPDEAQDVVALTYPSLKRETVKAAVSYTLPLLDTRLSACTYVALQEQFEFVRSSRKIQPPQGFNIASKVKPQAMLKVQDTDSALFSDLPPIPASVRLADDGTLLDLGKAAKDCGGQ
jgi:ABC-type nitrate/sulfonate/bicarbonate transport system substrate-binding protein